MTYVLRNAKTQDCEPVCELIVMAIEDLANQFTQAPDDETLWPRMHHLFHTPNTRFSEGFAAVIEDNGQVAAMGVAYPGSDMKDLTRQTVSAIAATGVSYDEGEVHRLTASKEANDDEFYIDNLAVYQTHRGKGYAKAIIEYFEAKGKALGYGKISILADLNNPKAQAIYENLGYVPDGVFAVLGHEYTHLVKRV